MKLEINFNNAICVLLLAGELVQAAEPVKDVRLSAICWGRGTIEMTNYNGRFLKVGEAYMMVAKASAGWVFTNWTDGYNLPVTNHPRLTFVMKTNSAFIANFVRQRLPVGNLDGVGIADIPLRVLAAVNAAHPGERANILDSWIITVAAVKPTALASVITTVVTAHPELLADAVTSAVAASPAQTYALVYAAARTPSASLPAVVAAASLGSPKMDYQIAQAALAVDPTAGAAILQAIIATIPELSDAITSRWSNTSGTLTVNKTLAILSQSMTAIGWPINPAPPYQPPHDYSQP